MVEKLRDYDLDGTLKQAGIDPTEANAPERAMADRFLQIHQGDPYKAGAALKRWKANQR